MIEREAVIANIRRTKIAIDKRTRATPKGRCLDGDHVWEPHYEDGTFDLCSSCKLVRIPELWKKPKKAIRVCTELLDGRNIASQHTRSVEVLIHPYFILRHTFRTEYPWPEGYVLIQPLVLLSLHNKVARWIVVGGGECSVTWPALMKVARNHVNDAPVALFKQLRAEVYGKATAWPCYLGEEPAY